MKFVQTSVFHNGDVITEGAVALWIASEQPLPVIARHGWEPMGLPMLVTRAEGTQIMELGGRPAAAAYEEELGLLPGELPADRFWDTALYHPFGLIQPDGSTMIRAARAKTDQGGLIIQGCLPPAGSAVQVMTGVADTLLDVVGDVTGAALDAFSNAGALLTFSCAARAVIFGNRTPEEAVRLQARAGSVPTFGFYCCGEFARTTGVLGTHNLTLTALAL